MRTIGLLDWFRTERRSQEQTLDGSQLDTALRAALGGSAVTVRSVLNIPAVSGSVGFIAGTVASLPIRLYRNKNGQSEEVTDDYRLRLLNEETGDLLDAFQWKCTLVRDYLLPGNGYTYVDWVSNRIDGLYYVDPMQVSAEIGADPIFKTARFFIGGRSYRDYEIMRILRNTRDGVTGSGLVAESPIQLETMLNALKYENRMVKTGAKKGFLKVEKDKKVSQTVLDQLRNSWRKMYGPDSEETTVILNDGVDFKDAGQTAVETQLNENKQTNAHEIYRIFNIAPTILEGDATAEDLKNTVRFAIAPVVKALQLAINRFCLLEAEKGVLAFEIDMDALDGTDMLARYQAYEVAIRNGWMQLDEVRYDEGRNPLGLKFIRLGLDTVIYDPESRMIYTPNTKEWASIDQKVSRLQVEIRADKKSMTVGGYVNVVGRDSRVLHDKTGPYVEQIMPGAFKKALAADSKVELRFNHKKILDSEDLELREDNIGMRAHAVVTDSEVIAAAEQKELRGWSFGFVKQKDHWKTDEEGTRRRFVDELELREVSILDKTPAYIATSIETRDDDEILVEFRADQPLEDGVDYIRQTESTTETKTTTLTPGDESVMFCAQKTVEIYKMRRRM